MPAKIRPFWRERVRSLTEREHLGIKAIHGRLEQEAKQLPPEDRDYPSERSIRRIQEDFKALPEDSRRPYRELHWPESFERGDLPWEVSTAALELLREHQKGELPRPSLGLVRWFVRVTMAAPDAGIDDRTAAARWLHGLDVLGDAADGESADTVRRDVESWLAFTPWRSGADAEVYAAAFGEAPGFQQFFVATDRDVGGLAVLMADDGSLYGNIRRAERGGRDEPQR